MMVRFEVAGTPAPQGSKRGFARGGKVVLVEQSRNVRPWRAAVATELRSIAVEKQVHFDRTVPVSVNMTFTFPRPKSHYRTGRFADQLRSNAPTYVATRPDLDKVVRSTLDGITESGIIADDCQVALLYVVQEFGPHPGVHGVIAAL